MVGVAVVRGADQDSFRLDGVGGNGTDVFGTPTYVLQGELFWGQDRLGYVERRIEELLAGKATTNGVTSGGM